MIHYSKLIKQNEINQEREVHKMIEFFIKTLTDIFNIAVPIAVIIELVNLLVSSFLNAAFRGRLWFGKY